MTRKHDCVSPLVRAGIDHDDALAFRADRKPEDVIACYDNGGRSADRYSFLIGSTTWNGSSRFIPCLSTSGDPEHPQGVSMWCDAAHPHGDTETHLGSKIEWEKVPKRVRLHVLRRLEPDASKP